MELTLTANTAEADLEEFSLFFDAKGKQVREEAFNPEEHGTHTFWLRPLTSAENGALMDRAVKHGRRGRRTTSLSGFTRGRICKAVVKARGDLRDDTGSEITKLDVRTCGLLRAWMETLLDEWVSEMNDLDEVDAGN